MLPSGHSLSLSYSLSSWALRAAKTFAAFSCIATLPAQTTFSGEYFLETDPGAGQGVAFTTDNQGRLDLTIPTDTLSFGLHRIGFRVQGADGNWSTNDFRSFLKLDALISNSGPPVEAEYFFDADPGVGQGTAATLSETGNLLLDLPTDAFSFGLNRIGVRVRDAQDIWSTTDFRSFLKLDALISQSGAPVVAEYFFDTDPGVRQGTEIALAADGSLTLDLSSSGFAFGLNKIGIRVRDADGIWSTTDFRSFLKLDAFAEQLPTNVSTIWWTIKDGNDALVKNGTWPASGSTSFLLARVIEVSDLTENVPYQLEVGAANSIGQSGPLSIHAFMIQPEGSNPNDTNNNGVPDDATAESWTFEDWLTATIGPDAPANPDALQSGFNDDPDRDGLTNSFEYLIGSDPLQKSPPLALNPETGNFLTITFTQIPAAMENVNVIVECATSLAPEDWLPVQTPPEIISTEGETQVLRYRDDEPISTDPKRFMRLRIEPKS